MNKVHLLIYIVVSISILSMGGCGEDSDELSNPPLAAIIHPADWADVFGTVKIVVDAVDDSAISVVELFIDGEAVTVLGESPYVYDWDTTNLDSGSMHTIYAKAIDDEGQAVVTNVIIVFASDAGVSGNTYTNWKYGFRISAPSSEWNMTTQASIYSEVPGLVTISSGLYGFSSAIVTVAAEVFTGEPSRYDALMDAQLRDMRIGPARETQVDGIPAKEIRVRFEAFLEPASIGKFIYCIKGKVAYLIVALAEESAHSAYETDMDEVIATFEFL